MSDRMREIRSAIDGLVSEYAALHLASEGPDDGFESEGGPVVHAWVLCYGATRIDWGDGREQVGMIHPDAPFSTRLGLLSSSVGDLLK